MWLQAGAVTTLVLDAMQALALSGSTALTRAPAFPPGTATSSPPAVSGTNGNQAVWVQGSHAACEPSALPQQT